MARTTTSDVQSVLERWFHAYGMPSRLRSDGAPQFRDTFTRWCGELGIRHELASAYNPVSNGLAEAGVRVLKETLKKSGVTKGAALEKIVFDLNSMSRGDGSGAPIEIFLGRQVNSSLPNAGSKFIQMKKEVEKRKKMQSRWMDRLGRCSNTDFKEGDQIRAQDPKTGVWNLKGEIKEIREHQVGGAKSYVIEGENGGQYLRNGRYIKLRISKAKIRVRVAFSNDVGCKSDVYCSQRGGA